jgi:hypothetical protein
MEPPQTVDAGAYPDAGLVLDLHVGHGRLQDERLDPKPTG